MPTTLNVGAIDLIHPELIRLTSPAQAPGRRLMKAHEELGCEPSFTCARVDVVRLSHSRAIIGP